MNDEWKVRRWAVVLCLASLPLTYPLVLIMIIALGQKVERTLVYFIGPSNHSSCAVVMQKWKARAEKPKGTL